MYRYTRGLLQRAVAERERLAEFQRQTKTASRNGATAGAVATGLVGLFAFFARKGTSEDDVDFDDED